jgi:hypothetical protein
MTATTKTTSKTLRCVLAAALLLGAQIVNAQSTPVACTTKANNLFVTNAGEVRVFLSVRADYVQVCGVNSDWKGVSPVACMSWVALLRSAVSRQADLIVYYNDPAVTNCTAIATYGSAPAPVYVMLKN